MNFYQILNVKQTASKSEIKSAYKSLIKKYHPDIYKGDKAFAERKTKEINEAFDTLSDPAKKAEYDATINPRPTYSDFSGYNSYTGNRYNSYSSSRYNPYSQRQAYSEPSKYSPYSNRRKRAQAEQYQDGIKGKSSASYTERVIFSKDDFKLFKDSLSNKKTASIVILGFSLMLVILIIMVFVTTSQLSSFYNSSDSYLSKKTAFKQSALEQCNNTHPISATKSLDVLYMVSKGDSAIVVEEFLGAPDKKVYNFDYLFYYYGNSFIMFEQSFEYVVLAFNDLGDLIVYKK